MVELTDVVIYTDGACVPNPGRGGYAAILLCGPYRRHCVGGFQQTTNNRMEITAAIVALQALKKKSKVTLYTDSQYLVDTMMKGWAAKWRSRGWMRNSKERASNADLWEQLLQLCRHHVVEFVWIRGHAGQSENEQCDRLSAKALQQPNLPADVGYEESLVVQLLQPNLFDLE